MRSPSKRIPPRFFSERRVKRRILVIALSYFLFFAVIIGRTFSLHLTDNTKLAKLAQSQYQKKITLAPKRGNIYDSHGEELAIDVKVDSLYANPRQISDPSALARQLSPIIGLDSQKIEKNLSKDKKFVWIKRRLSEEETGKIQALHNEALGLIKESKRFYPNKKLAATVLGAVGLDSTALAGLELYYDDLLKSSNEPVIVNQDARGQSYSPYTFVETEDSRHLVLTIDKTIQFITERELKTAVTNSQAKSGIAVVLKNQTGEVLAMASYPDFDPNQYSEYSIQNWKNRVITDSFEPGSIFKAVTAAAALESGRISLDQKFNCEGGSYPIGKFTIHDHGHYGAMALPDIIRVSSNIGAFKIAQTLGREEFSDTVSHFGFGKKTGIDLPGEVSGILAPASRWSTVQQGTIAFGQGISVTPLQIVNAYTAIANGGYLMRPFIVKKIVDSKGNVLQETKPQILRQVMSEVNAKKLIEILKLVVGPGGTGEAAQVEEYGVAGKTGTAQKVLEGRAGYAEGSFVASFVGIAPADHPDITVLVSINEPKGNHFGGVVAAPAFREIVRQSLPYLGVAPRSNKGPMIITKADEKKTESRPQSTSEVPGIKTQISGSESQVSSSKLSGGVLPEKGSSKREIPDQLTEVEPGVYRVPDWTGKSMRGILRDWDDSQLKLVVEGSGLCMKQVPLPGQVVKQGSEVRLSFKPPS
jgi:cell division protein FtsI (penicillin-binding protein 3)